MGRARRNGRVVVEVDDVGEGFRVIEYAAHEALRTGAQLQLVRRYRGPDHRDDAARELREAVTHVRRKMDCCQLSIRTTACEGSRLTVLPEVARNSRLLVIGRHRARGPYRVVASRADLLLATRTACPVAVVPRGWKPSPADRLVVVGVDGTPEAVDYAFATAARREARLVAVHIDSEPEALVGWQALYPHVRVIRSVSLAPAIEALMYESVEAGLLVIGARPGDPVVRHALAAATCPVAMVHN